MGWGDDLAKLGDDASDDVAKSEKYMSDDVSFADAGPSTVDDSASATDDTASGNDEYVDQNVNQQGTLGSAWGTLTDAGRRGLSGARREATSGFTKAAIAGGGLYTLTQAVDWKQAKAEAKQAKSKQKAYEQMLQRLKQIDNNDKLSAEEKRAAKQRVREMYRDMWGLNKSGGGGGSPLSGLLSLLGLGSGGGSGGGGPFSGFLGKFFIGLLGISAIWILPSLIKQVRGGA